MKRTLTCILLAMVLLASVAAEPVFSWYQSHPLYRDPVINSFSSTSTLNIISLLEGQPRTVRFAKTGTDTYEDVKIYGNDTKFADETMYLQLRTGISAGFFRFAPFDWLQAELTFQGGLNAVFQGFGGADNLGYDGIFFFGANMRLFNMVSLRAGLKHYSGHYGDETLLNLTIPSGWNPIEYTRDNNLAVGLSVEPTPNIKVYAEVSKPMEKTWMHPAIHIPGWVIKNVPSGGSLHDIEAGNEGIPTTTFADDYNAWIGNAGTELRLNFGRTGSLLLAFDVMAHQDGQTKHEVGGYDAENSWEFEYTVGLGVEFRDPESEGKAGVMVAYHDSRFPLLNYFYQRSRYVSVGLVISM